MDSYIQHLELSPDERQKIEHLAAPSAASLLSLVRASHGAFEAFYGLEPTRKLVENLEKMLSDEERDRLKRPPPHFPIESPRILAAVPKLADPKFDVAERDRVFEEIRALRAKQQWSPEVTQRIKELENQLENMIS